MNKTWIVSDRDSLTTLKAFYFGDLEYQFLTYNQIERLIRLHWMLSPIQSFSMQNLFRNGTAVERDVNTYGTIDALGNVRITAVVSRLGTVLRTFEFTGSVTGSGTGEIVSGTYFASTGPSESGTFSMTHD